MLIELYIFYEIVMIGFFVTSFFLKNEILWSITAVLAAVLMFSSFDIQINMYQYNQTISAYQPQLVSQEYTYLTWINLIFLGLAVLLGIWDIYNKYGVKVIAGGSDEAEDET